ncbi:AraC family transcriptional regulator [Arachidicoccus ginsenosidimutans]|uniref:helix-turn-helix domain-containing protein n=1 Tax=Arachidicoccus sp. BS20 TaxID=1850526 RepID=UPI0007F14A6F|nr:AraC family transcriptional regulator [Arachidicoccus sp. BS20]ANI88542.1 AraC family transcriptional regulator [Arachidicoccus sp. BS20]
MFNTTNIFPVNYSCHFSEFRDGEQFVQVHSFGMILQGTMELNDGEKSTKIKEGELYSARKNHLLKFVKYPPANGEFKSMSIYFDENLLRDFSKEYGCKADEQSVSEAFIKITKTKPLTNFMRSMLGYEDFPDNESTKNLLRLKQKEALLLLLQYDASLKNILFDFSEPHKIDLEAFMQKNFHFNVRLERFAYLTGRSLSTFKRDFENIFHQTPSRWLLQRRLKEAYYLIKEKGKMASDIYLDLGFEDLSHFSYTFKKQFGVAPSMV